MNRAGFLGGVTAGAAGALALPAGAQSAPDVTVRIEDTVVELAPGVEVQTTTYNGNVPGPILRFQEDSGLLVEVVNTTDTPNAIHWHGLILPPILDGTIELGTPPIPANGTLRFSLVPRPAGTHWYHTGLAADGDPDSGLYSGQYGFAIVDPIGGAGEYDREAFIAIHDWEPTFVKGVHRDAGGPFLTRPVPKLKPPARPQPKPQPKAKAAKPPPPRLIREAVFKAYTINGRMFGHGDPIRVRPGERVLFRFLNASPALTHRLAFVGHKFNVVALDGSPVPNPRGVDAIELGPGERVDAIVEMRNPGVWSLASTNPDFRRLGLGVVIAYANRRGVAVWHPTGAPWRYTAFGGDPEDRPTPDGRFILSIDQAAGDGWAINGRSGARIPPLAVQEGGRYRIEFRNPSPVEQPMHVHGHVFELLSVDGVATAGIFKDTVVVRPGGGRVEVELLAENPGRYLVRSMNEVHRDGGLVTSLIYT